VVGVAAGAAGLFVCPQLELLPLGRPPPPPAATAYWRRPLHKEAPPGPGGRFRFSERSIHGVTRLMRVPQLARAVRVAPQLPIGAVSHWVRVQVWLMYSEAIQMLLPSIAVAP
jgi:hypothetical protein